MSIYQCIGLHRDRMDETYAGRVWALLGPYRNGIDVSQNETDRQTDTRSLLYARCCARTEGNVQ